MAGKNEAGIFSNRRMPAPASFQNRNTVPAFLTDSLHDSCLQTKTLKHIDFSQALLIFFFTSLNLLLFSSFQLAFFIRNYVWCLFDFVCVHALLWFHFQIWNILFFSHSCLNSDSSLFQSYMSLSHFSVFISDSYCSPSFYSFFSAVLACLKYRINLKLWSILWVNFECLNYL